MVSCGTKFSSTIKKKSAQYSVLVLHLTLKFWGRQLWKAFLNQQFFKQSAQYSKVNRLPMAFPNFLSRNEKWLIFKSGCVDLLAAHIVWSCVKILLYGAGLLTSSKKNNICTRKYKKCHAKVLSSTSNFGPIFQSGVSGFYRKFATMALAPRL